MMNELNQVTVFAPATSSNIAVGFDILGFALDHLGDEVTLVKAEHNELKIESISSADKLPYDVQKNTATVALQAMLDHLELKQGFNVHIKKKIPLSSGLGGSAACAVASLVALNRLLQEPLSHEQLVQFALQGEEIACGAKHGDNVIPCLFGGITLIHSLTPLEVIQLPVMPLIAVLIHPHIQLDTRDSRAVLTKTIPFPEFIQQSAHLASFISALYETNYDRLISSCKDVVIEPLRAHLIPGFYDVQAAAYSKGALACSISGSGPTVFALAKNKTEAELIALEMMTEFSSQGIQSDVFSSPISLQAAKVIDEQ